MKSLFLSKSRNPFPRLQPALVALASVTAATDTTQTFEYGSTLSGWTPVAIPGGSGVIVNDQGGGIDKVEITVAKGANTKLFGRLKVAN